MLVHEFPDLNWVRSLRNDAASPVNTWKNIALNVKCRQVSRTGVESPYSLFLNKTGHSYCGVNKKQYRIEDDNFLLSRPGEQYDLIVDNLQQTETFNIHINKDFFHGWAHTLTTPHAQLLDKPFENTAAEPALFTQLYRKTGDFNLLIARLEAVNEGDMAGFDYVFGQVVQYLLLCSNDTRQQIANLPAVKQSVKADIYSRLAVAKDFIQSNYNTALNLDELSREIAISKFHFLRLFKLCYGISPYQYLAKIRLEKAARLLKNTNRPISEISDTLGFEYPNSFIKAFQKSYGTPPLQYRKAM